MILENSANGEEGVVPRTGGSGVGSNPTLCTFNLDLSLFWFLGVNRRFSKTLNWKVPVKTVALASHKKVILPSRTCDAYPIGTRGLPNK